MKTTEINALFVTVTIMINIFICIKNPDKYHNYIIYHHKRTTTYIFIDYRYVFLSLILATNWF